MVKIFDSNGRAYNIDLPSSSYGKEHYMICPICSPTRQGNHRKEKKLAVNMGHNPMLWRCNHCEESGAVITKEYLEQAKFKPIVKELKFMAISDGLVKWFWDTRKISKPTLEHFKISMSEEAMLQIRVPEGQEHLKGEWVQRKAINFKYFKNYILINIKFRDMYKNFKLMTGATKLMYNLDSLKEKKECWIVEGEPDVLAYYEAGITPVVSVPNGATISKKEREVYEETGKMIIESALDLSYLDDVIHEFDDMETIYIAVDDDPTGIKLREELARRLGKDKCQYMRFSNYYQKDEKTKCKDANDVLIHKGPEFLSQCHKDACIYPVEGISTADDYMDDLIQVFDNGYSKGLTTGYKSLDPHFLWVPGWCYTLNGYPGEGKSSLLFNLMAITTVLYNFKWGLYCPENYPEHSIVTTLAEIFVGNTASHSVKDRMSKQEFIAVIEDHIKKHFFFVKENKYGYTPKQLRAKKLELIKKHGINGFFTDPWKNLKNKEKDFSALNDELADEVRLATNYSLINIIAHHPPTPPRDKDKDYPAPGPMDLIGGQIWFSSMYGMVCVKRVAQNSFKNTLSEVHIQKQKVQKIGGFPTSRNNPVLLKYERRTNRFLEHENLDNEKSDWAFPIKNYFDLKQPSLEGF